MKIQQPMCRNGDMEITNGPMTPQIGSPDAL